MQQGFVNFMYLGRALDPPEGLATDPAFQWTTATATTVIDTDAGIDTRL